MNLKLILCGEVLAISSISGSLSVFMKAFVVTSALTFVPHNYNEFLRRLALDSRIQGLIVIQNKEFSFFLKALGLILTGAAPFFGWQLLKNFFDSSTKEKSEIFKSHGKKVFLVKDIHDEKFLKEMEQEKIDLLINARTRAFFKKKLLLLPRWGCVNIHHGLLPDQRGLMCDFWSHLLETPYGFSIHQMTSKLDDGALLKVVEVKTDGKNYLDSIAQAACQEAQAMIEVLDSIEKNQSVVGQKNESTDKTIYRKNPGLGDFYRLRRKGVQI